MIMNNDRFTHPLPRTVLTVSKCDVLTSEAKPTPSLLTIAAKITV
jgi:hypothetical protein